MLGEEAQDATPRVLGGRVLIADVQNLQERGLVVEERVAGVRVLLDVVRRADARSARPRACPRRRAACGPCGRSWRPPGRRPRARSRAPSAAPRSWAPTASNPRVALSSANPPPMQNPITPTLPVQSSRATSCARAASMSSNGRPAPGLQRPEAREQAAHRASTTEEIRREGDVPGRREPRAVARGCRR